MLIHRILKELHNLVLSNSLVKTKSIFINCIGYWRWRFALRSAILCDSFLKVASKLLCPNLKLKGEGLEEKRNLIRSPFLRFSCILVDPLAREFSPPDANSSKHI